MVDIPSTTATPPAQATPPATTVTPVETTVSDVPDKIQQLLRQLQVSATISGIGNDGTITLNSIIGNLTVILPAIVHDRQQQLTQQLIGLLQNQKPVTVVVQPGTPPTQAYILVPTPPATPGGSTSIPVNPQTASNIAQTQVLLQTVAPQQPVPQPVTQGTTFTAIVLPQNIALPKPLSPVFSQPYTQTGAQPVPPLIQQASAPQTTTPATPSSAATNAPQPLPQTTAPNLFPATNFTPDILNILEDAALVAITKAEAVISELEQQLASTPLTPRQQTSVPSPVAYQNTPATLAVPVPPLQVQPSAAPPPIQLSPTLAALLQPGTEVTLRVDAVAPPPVPPAVPGSQVQTPAAPLTLLPSQTTFSPGGIPLPPALPPAGQNQIVATVVGTGTNGQLILNAGNTTLYVKQTADLPTGSTLLITVEAKAPTLPVTLPDRQNFASLQQAISTLNQISPQLAQFVIANHIPQPGPALPGALLFLMSAFKQGSVRTWLGDDAVNALNRAGKFELVGKLAEQLDNAGQSVRDNVVGEWKAYPLPLQANNQFQAINLYVHEHGQKQSGQGSSSGRIDKNVRFLIDVRMSRLGALQLDGFVQTRKLDMIVRSERILPEGLHQELRTAYTKALGAVDYAGSLNFQVGRQHWLNLQKAAGPSTITT